MKSKFFGNGAKLALAVLAVCGTLFTSCYEKAEVDEAAKSTKEVTDLTNKLLKKNAETLKQTTVDTARLSERGIVDIETIKHTNEQLISALNDVRQIQIEGHKKREEASLELRRIEENLKSSLIQIANK